MTINFDRDWQRELWASPYRLWFELSQGGSPVTMFTRSYDRARCLARAALPSERVTAVIAAYPSPSRELGGKWHGWTRRKAFDILEKMGVPTSSPEATWRGYTYPHHPRDAGDRPWQHRAVGITWDQADILLWNQVAKDLGVAPQAPVLSKLVDVERGVTVHAYDDRGMDITALDPCPIAELHARFDAWLLDHDRLRMAEAFAASFPAGG
jgi:hypothetical protein